MKTLSEKLKELHTDRTYAFNHYGDNPESYRAFDAGMNHAVELLQAWLREADKAALKLCEDDAYVANLFRYEILGTTRQEDGQ